MAGSFSFKDWYAANGERLNEQRKNRYHTDPEYRDRVLEVNRASRQRREGSAEKKKTRKRAKGPRSVVREIDGHEQKLYTIGVVAQALGCSIQALRLWEKKGIIPATAHRSPDSEGKGHRLYTIDMVTELRRILLEKGRLQATRPKSSSRPLRRHIRFADGTIREMEVYLIGMLAQTLNRNAVTLEQLEARGLFPSTPLRASETQRRLYTTEMIEAAWEAFKDYNNADGPLGAEEWKTFTAKVVGAWIAQKMMGAVLVEEVPSGVPHEDIEDSSD